MYVFLRIFLCSQGYIGLASPAIEHFIMYQSSLLAGAARLLLVSVILSIHVCLPSFLSDLVGETIWPILMKFG